MMFRLWTIGNPAQNRKQPVVIPLTTGATGGEWSGLVLADYCSLATGLCGGVRTLFWAAGLSIAGALPQAT